MLQDLVEGSNEHYTASNLMGLGPIRDTSHLKDPLDLIHDERFKVCIDYQLDSSTMSTSMLCQGCAVWI